MLDVNTTPLIDVMLVLLVMLIITIPVQLHAVKLDFPPPSKSTPPVPPAKVIVAIDFDSKIYVDGVEVDQAGLEAKFTQYAAMSEDSRPNVLLQPNKLAPYKLVAKVMAAAQRLHVSKLGLIGDEQF